mgnify:CR=1 FL=1
MTDRSRLSVPHKVTRLPIRGRLVAQKMTRWPHAALLQVATRHRGVTRPSCRSLGQALCSRTQRRSQSHAPASLSILPTARRPGCRSCRLRPGLVGDPADRTPAWPPLPRAGPQREKTTVRLPFMRTRRSAWKRTAWARTRRSTSWPRATMSGVESAWETRVTSCSMIGPSSRSAVT